MIINATIQVIPLSAVTEALPIVDEAIALIQQSGISYTVGAFETTLEGEYEAVQQLIRQVEDFCYNNKQRQFLVYTKLHICGGTDILAGDKTDKFRQ